MLGGRFYRSLSFDLGYGPLEASLDRWLRSCACGKEFLQSIIIWNQGPAIMSQPQHPEPEVNGRNEQQDRRHFLKTAGAAGVVTLATTHSLRAADAVVVVAGMEAALASVVGGHVASPVIAVPTSVGYGASLGGIAALLSVLNSCAASVSVVNIDAGFKGGYIAGLIGRQLAKIRHESLQD